MNTCAGIQSWMLTHEWLEARVECTLYVILGGRLGLRMCCFCSRDEAGDFSKLPLCRICLNGSSPPFAACSKSFPLPCYQHRTANDKCWDLGLCVLPSSPSTLPSTHFSLQPSRSRPPGPLSSGLTPGFQGMRTSATSGGAPTMDRWAHCLSFCMVVCLYVCMYVCMYNICMYVCICMYIHCRYVCMYVCMYICVFMFTCLTIFIWASRPVFI